MDAKMEQSATEQLVILVHGINTRALWMGEIKPALEKAGFSVAPTSYGKFGVFRFLSPFSWFRKKAINRVVQDIRTARRAYKLSNGADPKQMSVISHSFGTYVVSKILTDIPEFEWHRVIFCGSVVREDFPFEQVLERFQPPLINEVGTRDFWPALAESAGWGYGSVGSTGFNRPPVETRWHNGFTHSDFLTEDFCDTYWTPFLQGKKPMRAGKAAEMPRYIRAITWLPARWLPVAFLAFLGVGIVKWDFLGGIPFTRESTSKAEMDACRRFPAMCDLEPAGAASGAKSFRTESQGSSNLECFNGLGNCAPVTKQERCFKGLGDCAEKNE